MRAAHSEAAKVDENRQNPEWFLATVVMEISVEGETRNVVHRNLFLVSACSPEEAYDKALRLGHEGETTYGNPAGRGVRHSFRGIAELDTLVDGELVDGAELAFEQHIGLSQEEIQALMPSKDRLGAFFQPGPRETDIPDYSSRDVLKGVAEMLLSERDPSNGE